MNYGLSAPRESRRFWILRRLRRRRSERANETTRVSGNFSAPRRSEGRFLRPADFFTADQAADARQNPPLGWLISEVRVNKPSLVPCLLSRRLTGSARVVAARPRACSSCAATSAAFLQIRADCRSSQLTSCGANWQSASCDLLEAAAADVSSSSLSRDVNEIEKLTEATRATGAAEARAATSRQISGRSSSAPAARRRLVASPSLISDAHF